MEKDLVLVLGELKGKMELVQEHLAKLDKGQSDALEEYKKLRSDVSDITGELKKIAKHQNKTDKKVYLLAAAISGIITIGGKEVDVAQFVSFITSLIS